MEVLLYQLSIFMIIVVFKGHPLVITLCTAWTVTHIFYPPLMFLQFGVIFVGWLVCSLIKKIKGK